MATQFPPQPPVVFPNTVTNKPTQSSHSDGSFGTVFIVLAAILVISAIACCLGRVCDRRHSKDKPSKQHKQKKEKFRPDRDGERDGRDIEFGFEKGLASKPMSNGEHHGGGGGGSGGRGFKTFHGGRINDVGSGHNGAVDGDQFKGPSTGEGVFSVGEPKPGRGPP